MGGAFMKKQRQKTAGILPDPSLVPEYICLAQSKGDQNPANILNDYVAHGRRCLIAIYKSQNEQVKAGERKSIDDRIVKFVREELHRCAEDSDPFGSVEAFVAQPQSRGRPRTPYRDLDIAIDVAKRLVAGHSVDGACHDVSDERADRPSFEQVRRIYFKQKRINQIAISIAAHGWRADKKFVAARSPRPW
jgi:hypothetical protein